MSGVLRLTSRHLKFLNLFLSGTGLIPHDLISEFVMPELRGLLAHKLYEKGLGQLRISKLLGISQPMISKYMSVSYSEYLKRLEDLGLDVSEVVRTVEVLVERLVNDNYREYLELISNFLNSILRRGLLCKTHKKISSVVPRDCEVCFKLFEEVSDPYVEEVKVAYEILSFHPRGHEIIPEVGMNIVSAPPNARDFRDVAGFSGRIVKSGDRVIAVGDPIKGGSKHTANVLLKVMSRFPNIRSAIAIKYDEKCIEKLSSSGLNVVKTGPHKSIEEFFISLEKIVSELGGEPDAIADSGGLGIEPVIYVFSSSAIKAVKKALTCVE